MYQQTTLIGHLTKDPELKTTPSGKEVANVDIATNKKFKNQAGELVEQVEFHSLVIWNGASAFCKYLKKGSKVFILGEIRTRNWEKKDGTKAYKTEIIVSEFKFLDSFKKEEKSEDKYSEEDTQVNNTEGEADESDNEISVKNIPF